MYKARIRSLPPRPYLGSSVKYTRSFVQKTPKSLTLTAIATAKMGDASISTPTPSSPITYFQPAEHLPHSHTLMAFPNPPGCARDEAATDRCRREVVSVAKAIAQFEPVWLYAHPEHVHVARSLVGDNDEIIVKEAEVDNLWIRDLGPVFVHNKKSGKVEGAVDFNFNYWGRKFEETVDDTFARRILESSDFKRNGVQRVQAGVVSEGGALEIDGEGTLMVTDTSVINENRNPGKSKKEIEKELKRVLGVEKVIWLKGVEGVESTDWHVDAWCRFVRPGEVLLSRPPANAHKKVLAIYEDALGVLGRETDARGRKLKVSVVDEPDQEKLLGGAVHGMVTSYVNYLLVNGGVVMAKFGEEETDGRALTILRELFPKRRIEQVFINELPRFGGGIHCATQHVPA